MHENVTPESIKEEILARLPDTISTREGSYLRLLIEAAAYELWKQYQSQNALLPIAFVNETSGGYLEKRCAEYGITRKPGTKAVTLLTFTGADGAVIPAGAAVSTAAGLEFAVLKEAVLVNGTAQAKAEAAEAGSAYNTAEGQIHQIVSSLPGVEAVTAGAAAGGTDPESDADLFERLNAYRRNPASSGNSHDYETWARETSGVGKALVLSLWDGPGTVKVLITDQSRGPAAVEIVTACKDHIEQVRPIGAEVTVESVTALPVSVRAVVTLTGSVRLEDVKAKFTAALQEYLLQSVFVRDELLYNRIAFFMLEIDGVSDYTSLTVNGGTSNIPVALGQVATLGTVEVTV